MLTVISDFEWDGKTLEVECGYDGYGIDAVFYIRDVWNQDNGEMHREYIKDPQFVSLVETQYVENLIDSME